MVPKMSPLSVLFLIGHLCLKFLHEELPPPTLMGFFIIFLQYMYAHREEKMMPMQVHLYL